MFLLTVNNNVLSFNKQFISCELQKKKIYIYIENNKIMRMTIMILLCSAFINC